MARCCVTGAVNCMEKWLASCKSGLRIAPQRARSAAALPCLGISGDTRDFCRGRFRPYGQFVYPASRALGDRAAPDSRRASLLSPLDKICFSYRRRRAELACAK